MSQLLIEGGNKLFGEIHVGGAKNSVLPLLAATFLCEGKSVLHNCPVLSDVKASINILEGLGCICKREGNTLTVDSKGCYGTDIPDELMREMRSSIVFMGAVAAKSRKAVMSLPGGCELGPRPIDIHIDSLKRLGAEITCESGNITCSLPNGIVSGHISLKFPSVGATENIILVSALSKAVVIIHNAAREPEITDLINFLNLAGANISGAGTDTITIKGVEKLHGVQYRVMTDRIIVSTVMCAVSACGGRVCIKDADSNNIMPVISILKDCGCDFSQKDGLTISMNTRLKNFDTVATNPYPGFPTDSGPLLVAAATVSKGTGVFTENIFDNRFRYIDELKRFGADIKTVGRVAVITGVSSLHGAVAHASDLRGGAALVLAALTAKEPSVIKNIDFIDRGYERIEEMFGKLGAEIKRQKE